MREGADMLLTGYTKRISRPECLPNAQSLHCHALLNEDISEVLPYLNAELGGDQYCNEPPEVMFHNYGKIIKVGASEIAVNALKDEEEADKILEWLKDEINQAWENRSEIVPRFTGKIKPKLMEILKLLPKTNCKKCGRPTCMVFASHVVEGGRGPEHCPELPEPDRDKLSAYLAGFDFD
jgi:ArsR family metal-binding transcriptional regulator